MHVEALTNSWLVLAFIRLEFDDAGGDANYFVPLLLETESQAEATIAVIMDPSDQQWSAVDGPANRQFQRWLIDSAEQQSMQIVSDDTVCSWQTTHPDELRAAASAESRLLSGEQSNSNIAYGSKAIIKVFRRVQPGLNPDVELGRYLTERAKSPYVAPLLADWSITVGGAEPSSIGLAQTMVPNTGDGWSWLLEAMQVAFDDQSRISEIESAVNLLGQRTAEIHAALARGDGPNLAPESISADQTESWRAKADAAFAETRQQLTALNRNALDERTRDLIARFSQESNAIRQGLDEFTHLAGYAKTRVHGDFHLGQTLHTETGDWVLIDFEGEPARSLAERRARNSPLKDVAGMIRSLAYARAFASIADSPSWTDEHCLLDDAFIEGYRSAIASFDEIPTLVPTDEAGFMRALRPWVIEKAIYEIAYEIDNRPDWLWAPLAALFSENSER
jgi:maltose alpha-D-glucosyltransferase/alpha-amylase